MSLASLSASKLDRDTEFFQALVRYSAKIEALNDEQFFAWDNASRNNRQKDSLQKSATAQLMPLSKKDLCILDRLFDREDIDAIDADIFEALLVLWPDPCWEDDPFEVYSNSIFDFLSEFL